LVDELVTLALADGRGPVWFGLGLATSVMIVAMQVQVLRGRHVAHWPLLAARTRAGQLSMLVVYVAVVVFCLLGLTLGW
jgi:hypothetical protein